MNKDIIVAFTMLYIIFDMTMGADVEFPWTLKFVRITTNCGWIRHRKGYNQMETQYNNVNHALWRKGLVFNG